MKKLLALLLIVIIAGCTTMEDKYSQEMRRLVTLEGMAEEVVEEPMIAEVEEPVKMEIELPKEPEPQMVTTVAVEEPVEVVMEPVAPIAPVVMPVVAPVVAKVDNPCNFPGLNKENQILWVGCFENDGKTVTKENRKNIIKVTKEYSKKDGRYVVIGYTDKTGPIKYNYELSEDRAQSVANEMRKVLGEESNITVDGYGEDETFEELAMNRRVEVFFIPAAAENNMGVLAPTKDEDENTRYIYFDTDKYVASKAEVVEIIEYAKGISGREGTIIVEGYTDRRATKEYNITLSENRGKFVGLALQRLLGNQNIKIEIDGRGESQKFNGLRRNRRVEMKFVEAIK